MNQFVEDYLAAVATSALASGGGTATVLKGTTSSIAEPDEDHVLCLCDDMEGTVKNLRLARCRFTVRTSALTGNRATHAQLADIVSSIFEADLPAASTFGIFEIESSGYHVSSNQTGQGENNCWITSIEFTMGVILNPSANALTYGGNVLTVG